MAPMTSQLLFATLTGSALAALQAHPRHAELHRRHTSASVAIPYGYGNSTGHLHYASSGAVKHHTSTQHVKETKTVYVTQSAVNSPAAPNVEEYHNVAAAQGTGSNQATGSTQSAGSNQGDTCPSVVTVTATAINTVTVTAGVPTSSSSAAPSPSTTTAVVAQADGKEAQGYGGYGQQSQKPSSSSSSVTTAAAVQVTTQQLSQTPSAYSQPSVQSSPSAPAYNQPASSSSSSAAAAQSSSSSAPTVCKRGVSGKKGCASTKDSRDNCQTLNGAGAGMSWIYDWEAGESDLGDMEYVPMLHSIDGEWMSWFTSSAAVKTAKYAMLPNEPMISGEAATGRTVTPAEIDAIYPQFKAAISSSAIVLSPSICGNQDGIDWLSGYNKDHYDLVNAHYYEDCTSQQGADGLNSYLGNIKSAIPGKNIWVTELGCHVNGASQTQIQAFMKAAVSALEADSSVDRYSWYVADSTSDMTQGWLMNGTLPSVYGQDYTAAGCA